MLMFVEQEEDGWWITDVMDLLGVLAYDQTVKNKFIYPR